MRTSRQRIKRLIKEHVIGPDDFLKKKVLKRQLRRIIKEEKAKLLREAPMGDPIDYEARDKKALQDAYTILSDLESDLMIDAGQGQGRDRSFEQKLMGQRAEDYRTELLKAMDLLESMGAIG